MNFQDLKLTAYIRFVIGGLYFLNYLIMLLTFSQSSPEEPPLWLSDFLAGLVALVYLTYCIRQGIKELKNQNSELPYPRILAIIIEMFSVVAFVFLLFQIEQIDLISILPNFVIVAGMGYFLTQNLKIAFSKS